MRLITWDMAIGHLKLSIREADPLTAALEADIRLKVDIAEALVLDYVNQRLSEADEWSEQVGLWNVQDGSPEISVPPQVQGAVLVMLAKLHRYRGDDTDADAPKRGMGELHPQAVSYLYRLRDPAVA